MAGAMSKPSDALGQAVRWTAEEDERLRSLYPHYDQLRAALPHRSLGRMGELGVGGSGCA